MKKESFALVGALGAVAAVAAPAAAQESRRNVVDYDETKLDQAQTGLDRAKLVAIEKAKTEYLRQAAREGRLLDAREVAVAPVGDHFFVYPTSDKVHLRIVDEQRGGDSSSLSFEVSTEAGSGRQAAIGLGFAPSAGQVGHGCYWLNGNSLSSNRAHWCWTKTKVLNDGDNSKDYYSYKRRISAYPSDTGWGGLTGWYVRGITLRSEPTTGTASRFKGWTDWEPASFVSNGNTNMNLGISAGPMDIGFSADVSGGTNPTQGPDTGRFQTTWSTGATGHAKQAKATAWHIGVTTGEGEVPFWGDYQLVTFCQGIHANCQNHSSS